MSAKTTQESRENHVKTTQDKPESIAKVLMDYFSDYEMMKANKLPWPTPEYLLRLLKRVFKASTAERSAMSKPSNCYCRLCFAQWSQMPYTEGSAK